MNDLVQKEVGGILKNAGICIDGPDPWDIRIHDPGWFKRVLLEKNLGLGESYMDGWWDCQSIDQMICRLLSSDAQTRVAGSLALRLRCCLFILFNRQSRSRSRIVARRHYDLDNDLFFSFLDDYHQYSCGYFRGTRDLDEAQIKKLELIAAKLELTRTDHLLDIGSGWGGLARYAAENFNCRVTGVNISKAQLDHARKACSHLPVTFLDCDYRQINGFFDKIVSVGMFEHVGYKNYAGFMKTAHNCLKRNGIFLLHTIGSNKSMVSCDPWIEKYIFPNGMLPSLRQITKACEPYFVIEDLHNLGPDYDQTLMAWNERFQKAWPQLKNRYDERFKRMWEYYLLSCAGAFRSRDIQIWQIVMTKIRSGTPRPNCRFINLRNRFKIRRKIR